jgi:hypothetical protein
MHPRGERNTKIESSRRIRTVYAGRAGHFGNEHYLCNDSSCLDAKFIVFASDSELKKHRLMTHNDTMSRQERRAALSIPINVTVTMLYALHYAL